MSLAASGGLGAGGGGGMGGGMMLAHQANAVGVPPAQPPPQANTTGTPAAPPSAGLLGADLLDKSQGLSLKNVKNLSHLPIVAIDLHGSEPHVAMFPKKPEDPSKGSPPMAVSSIKIDLLFQPGDTAHKTLRKYLAKSKSYTSLKSDCFATTHQKDAVCIKKPHRWLGLRRTSDAHDFVRKDIITEELSGPAISEETSQGVGVCAANSTLDGSIPTGDDFDRVVFKVRLLNSKKAISVVPEEAVEMFIREAQQLVASKLNASLEDEEIEDYPCAMAVPAWACHDAAVEALLEAMGSGGVLLQRNVAALAGALLRPIDGSGTPLLERMNKVHDALQKEHQKLVAKDPNARFEDEIMILVFGMTTDGFEATAVQVSSVNVNNISCLFGDFKVISNVSYLSEEPVSKMQMCAVELEKSIETIAPEADGPAGIILCGTLAEQKQMMEQWERIKNDEWNKVPVFVTGVDTVAKGTAVLGAVSHGRLSQLDQDQGKKARAELGIRVQNVAPVAVAIQMNYFGGADDKWTPIKTIFDFDRQIPAGPNTLDLNAAECAVYRSGRADELSEDDFIKATKQNEGAKGIPQREEAALNFKAKILQKWTRDGEWKQVGDVLEPLVKTEESKDGKVKRIGCERISWEISLGVTGMITSSLIGERYVLVAGHLFALYCCLFINIDFSRLRILFHHSIISSESVVVATKSARNSAIRYYLGIAFAILFVGYFLFKSYWDDYLLNRDTKRLLAYYKHAMPGSYQDGDFHNARYTCYKYRNNKAKLWKNLEKKYGFPVLATREYDELFAEAAAGETTPSTEADDETVDLDKEETQQPPNQPDNTQDEPDL